MLDDNKNLDNTMIKFSEKKVLLFSHLEANFHSSFRIQLKYHPHSETSPDPTW